MCEGAGGEDTCGVDTGRVDAAGESGQAARVVQHPPSGGVCACRSHLC